MRGNRPCKQSGFQPLSSLFVHHPRYGNFVLACSAVGRRRSVHRTSSVAVILIIDPSWIAESDLSVSSRRTAESVVSDRGDAHGDGASQILTPSTARYNLRSPCHTTLVAIELQVVDNGAIPSCLSRSFNSKHRAIFIAASLRSSTLFDAGSKDCLI
jgi:hypothetical protein